MKIKFRYIAAAVFVVASIIATPFAVRHAYDFRGYMAFGGEWMVINLGAILALVAIEIGKWRDSVSSGGADDEG